MNFLLPMLIIYLNPVNWSYKPININYTSKILFQCSQPSLPSNFIIYNSHKPGDIEAESIIKKLNYFLSFSSSFGGGFSCKLLLLL